MKVDALRNINDLGRNSNVFRLVRKMKIGNTDIVGGKCMQGNNETLYFNQKDRPKRWKAHMSKI